MHDFTVRQLNDHRLAQFDAEVALSRHSREAARRRSDRRAVAPVLARALNRWLREQLAWALAKARLRDA